MKKISLANFKNIVKDNTNQETETVLRYPIANKEIEIIVQHFISTEDMISFVNSVIESSFENEIYYPMNKEIAIKRCFLAYFTNVPHLGDNKIFDTLFYNTEIYSNIKALISYTQITELIQAIEEGIEFKQQKIFAEQKQKLNQTIQAITKEQAEVITEIQNLVSLLKDTFENADFDMDKLETMLDKASSLNVENITYKVLSDIEENKSND